MDAGITTAFLNVTLQIELPHTTFETETATSHSYRVAGDEYFSDRLEIRDTFQ
jgi:hypothetical protein